MAFCLCSRSAASCQGMPLPQCAWSMFCAHPASTSVVPALLVCCSQDKPAAIPSPVQAQRDGG